MTDQELKELTVAHEQYMHERINGAYRAGVRHCLELLQEDIKYWCKTNEGACQGDLSVFPYDTLEANMKKLLETLYV